MTELYSFLQISFEEQIYGDKCDELMKTLGLQEKKEFKIFCSTFYLNITNYLETRFDLTNNNIFSKLGVYNLNDIELFTFNNIKPTVNELKITGIDNIILQREYCNVKTIYDEIPRDLKTSEKWIYINRRTPLKEFKKIIEFIFSIPVSNASSERIFSLFGQSYTDVRNKMGIDLIKSELLTKYNIKKTCVEFKKYISLPINNNFIEMAKGNEKYERD